MRKSTIASLLIICGSTAAIANAATMPVGGGIQNTTNNTVDSTMPDNTTMSPAPTPTPTPDTSTINEATPPNATF